MLGAEPAQPLRRGDHRSPAKPGFAQPHIHVPSDASNVPSSPTVSSTPPCRYTHRDRSAVQGPGGTKALNASSCSTPQAACGSVARTNALLNAPSLLLPEEVIMR